MGTQDLSLDQEIEVAVFPSTTEPKNIFEEILDYTFVALVSMQVVAKGTILHWKHSNSLICLWAITAVW